MKKILFGIMTLALMASCTESILRKKRSKEKQRAEERRKQRKGNLSLRQVAFFYFIDSKESVYTA